MSSGLGRTNGPFRLMGSIMSYEYSIFKCFGGPSYSFITSAHVYVRSFHIINPEQTFLDPHPTRKNYFGRLRLEIEHLSRLLRLLYVLSCIFIR